MTTNNPHVNRKKRGGLSSDEMESSALPVTLDDHLMAATVWLSTFGTIAFAVYAIFFR